MLTEPNMKITRFKSLKLSFFFLNQRTPSSQMVNHDGFLQKRNETFWPRLHFVVLMQSTSALSSNRHKKVHSIIIVQLIYNLQYAPRTSVLFSYSRSKTQALRIYLPSCKMTSISSPILSFPPLEFLKPTRLLISVLKD